MKRLFLSAAFSAASLGACDQKAVEHSFNTSFARNAQASCMKSATEKGAPAAAAQSYCSCFVQEVTAWPLNEKMNFNPASEKFKAVVARCAGAASESAPN